MDFSPAPATGIVGNHVVWKAVEGKHLSEARDVIVWLPPGYEEDASRRYPVLYTLILL